jgi:hypothetical protein
MKFKDNKLFDFINYIFKNGNETSLEYNPPVFLVNRWISMANPLFSKIVNLTTNKWCTQKQNFDIKSFYRTILPTYKQKIAYIKKKEKEKEDTYNENIANIMECSQREILLYNRTLEELNITNK